ncbi:MAG: hypothetical protein KGP01_02015 [Actinomycetales bacterium]|nr:hypothetical protein [Actinomycetales bacterium]
MSATDLHTEGSARHCSAARLTVMDLDGVCADVRHRLHHLARRPKDWEAFFAACVDDAALPLALEVAAAAAADPRGPALAYLSGRPERYRALTTRWLTEHGFPDAPVYLRPDVDHRPARFFKPEVLARLGGPAAIEMVYDDDVHVVDALISLGYPVFHVTWMPAADVDEQLALFEAQEKQGRT